MRDKTLNQVLPSARVTATSCKVCVIAKEVFSYFMTYSPEVGENGAKSN